MTAPVPLTTAPFPGVSTNTYLQDATQVSMWLPTLAIDNLAGTSTLQQGAWAFYANRTPNVGTLSFGTYNFGAAVPTPINLLPTIVADPYTAYTDAGRTGDTAAVENLKLITADTFGSDQLNYSLKNGLARQFLQAFTGDELLPETVDLTGFSPVVYSQGLVPNSYAHSLAHVINISRTTSHLANQRAANLQHALTLTAGVLPSRMHMTALHNRVRYQMFLSPDYSNGDVTSSAATMGFVPVFSVANFGVTTEAPQNPSNYADPAFGGAFTYPQAANQKTMSASDADQSRMADLWQKGMISFDGYVNSASTTITPDLKGLQWRSLSDPSLQINPNARLSAKRLKKKIHQHLGRGIPLALQVNVYDNWRAQMVAQPTNPEIPLPLANAAPIGSHFFTLAGYNDTHYVVMNSMGANVGVNGNHLLPKEYVDFEQDCMAGTGTFLLTSTCWTSHNVNLSKCVPTTQGCGTNQNPIFSWRTLFT